ncbi:hypothetical protein CHUAL_002305 [Chamberlinius hualienensis]
MQKFMTHVRRELDLVDNNDHYDQVKHKLNQYIRSEIDRVKLLDEISVLFHHRASIVTMYRTLLLPPPIHGIHRLPVVGFICDKYVHYVRSIWMPITCYQAIEIIKTFQFLIHVKKVYGVISEDLFDSFIDIHNSYLKSGKDPQAVVDKIDKIFDGEKNLVSYYKTLLLPPPIDGMERMPIDSNCDELQDFICRVWGSLQPEKYEEFLNRFYSYLLQVILGEEVQETNTIYDQLMTLIELHSNLMNEFPLIFFNLK